MGGVISFSKYPITGYPCYTLFAAGKVVEKRESARPHAADIDVERPSKIKVFFYQKKKKKKKKKNPTTQHTKKKKKTKKKKNPPPPPPQKKILKNKKKKQTKKKKKKKRVFITTALQSVLFHGKDFQDISGPFKEGRRSANRSSRSLVR